MDISDTLTLCCLDGDGSHLQQPPWYSWWFLTQPNFTLSAVGPNRFCLTLGRGAPLPILGAGPCAGTPALCFPRVLGEHPVISPVQETHLWVRAAGNSSSPGPPLENNGRAASAASGKDLSPNKCISMTISYISQRDGQKQKLFTWLWVPASSSQKTDESAKRVAITTPLSCPHRKAQVPLGRVQQPKDNISPIKQLSFFIHQPLIPPPSAVA